MLLQLQNVHLVLTYMFSQSFDRKHFLYENVLRHEITILVFFNRASLSLHLDMICSFKDTKSHISCCLIVIQLCLPSFPGATGSLKQVTTHQCSTQTVYIALSKQQIWVWCSVVYVREEEC